AWSAAWRTEKERQALLKEQAGTRQRLYESLVEQAQAERRAGNRGRSLDLFRQALDLKSGDELRPEAILTIASPEVRLMYEVPFVSSFPSAVFSHDLTLLAESVEAEQGEGSKQVVRVRELPSGRMFGDVDGVDPVAFRPGTKHLAVTTVRRLFQTT